jgi:hypothetical protein
MKTVLYVMFLTVMMILAAGLAYAGTTPPMTALVSCDSQSCKKIALFKDKAECEKAGDSLILLMNRFKNVAPRTLVCAPAKTIVLPVGL